MQKKECKEFLMWLVELRELNKNEDEINELVSVYFAKFEKFDLSFLKDKSWIKLVEYWIEYKAEKKQKYKSLKSVQIFCKHLAELSQGNIDIAAAIIQQSIANNYSGIFQIKSNGKLTTTNEKAELNSTIEKHFGTI